MEEANGGNAEMAMETSNLKSTGNLSLSPAAAGKKIDEPSSPMDSQAALSPSITNNTPNEQIKMEEDEVNGDLKPDVNKKSDITVKRKLRKSKSNSTSSVETDAKQKTRGHKRKSPDIDNNNPTIENDDENIDDFIGFDCKKKDNDHVLKLLLKLIAEAEIEDSPSAPLPKRGRLLSKGRQSVGISDEKTKQIESPKIKNNVGADLTNNSLTEKSSKLIEKIETNNSIYKEPFKYGWRRELIYKGLPDVNNKKSADVYYYSPKGKKVKNIKEVGDCLTTKELTLDNFTFNTEPIGVDDPALEVIRDTKRLRSEAIGGGATPVKKTVVGKRVSIGKKVSPVQPGKTTGPKVMLPKNSGNAATATAGFKVKLPSVKRGSLKKEQRAPKESESLPAQWPPATPSRRAPAPLEKSSPPKTKRTIQKAKLQAPCSIKCSLSMGLIPNLQCVICLCLYHPKCVGGTESLTKKKYICKNCQPVEAPTPPAPVITSPAPTPPALIPISMISSSIKSKFTPPVVAASSSSDVDPTIPREKLPKPINSFSNKEQQVPKDRSWFARRNEYAAHNNTGSVLKPAQNIAVLGDKRFIVIPKNNSMSVQPAIKPRKNRFNDRAGLFSDNLLNDLREERANQQRDSSILDKIDKFLEKNVENKQIPGDSERIDDKEKEEISKMEIEGDEGIGKIVEEKKGDDGKDKNEEGEKENGEKQGEIGEQMETSSNEISSAKEKQKEPTPETTGTIDKKKTLAVEPDKSQYFMASICAGYNALPRIFQYLKVQELLRASRVCKMWHDLASRKVLWKTVRLKNSQVTDWNGLVECLNRHNTENLDLRKMIIPGEQDLCWNNLIQVISTIKSLVKLDLCRCPSTFVEDIMKNCTKIQVLNAITIKCQSLSLSNIDNMINCKELRLKAINSMTISDLSSIEKLDKLTLLSLTSIKDLGKQNIDIIGSLINLEILELGECSDFPASFGTNVLEKLIKLEKIRLEKGQGTCCTFDILDSLSKMKKIQELELINFDVKQGFDQRLAKCCNLKKLLIIPTYISQSATSNNMVLGGVTQLADSLEVFVWGVTRELLGVTDIFIQQSSDNNKEDLTASIPVLKPVPCVKLIEDGHNEKIDEKDEKSLNTTKPQIDVLPLAKVEKLLAAALPNTRVEILKIRFAETWRQSISDTQLQ